jgi:hypothetical protein
MRKANGIYHENSPQQDAPARLVTGRYLAKNWLSARERAQLAADIVGGRVAIDASTLTIGQVITLARANVRYFNEVRFPDRVKGRQQKKLAAVKAVAPEPTLAERFAQATPSERLMCARVVGPAAVWDHMIAPLV